MTLKKIECPLAEEVLLHRHKYDLFHTSLLICGGNHNAVKQSLI